MQLIIALYLLKICKMMFIDFKEDTIVIDEQNNVLLIDFGSAFFKYLDKDYIYPEGGSTRGRYPEGEGYSF